LHTSPPNRDDRQRQRGLAMTIVLRILLLASVLATIFVIDINLPGTLAFGMLYVLAILFAMLTGSIPVVVGTTLVAMVLAIAGHWLSPESLPEVLIDSPLGHLALNLVLIALVGAFAAGFLFQARQKWAAHDAQRDPSRKLQSTSEMLEMATSLTGVGGWSIVLDEDRIYWTDEVRRIHQVPEGYQPTLEEGLAFYAPESRERIIRVFDRCVEHSEHYDEELQIVTGKGDRRWVRAVGRPLRDDNGAIIGVHGALADIEEQKRSRELNEQRQREANELSKRLTVTLEGMIDGFHTLDHEWRVTFINRVGAQLVQRSREDLIGKNLWEEFPEIVGTVVEEKYRHAMSTGETVAFDIWFEPLETWFEIRAYRTAEGLGVHYQDITERRRADQELRLLHSAVDHTNDIVMITEAEPIDAPGPKIVYVNPAFERLTGFERDQAIGRSPRILQGPKTSREELDRIRRALEAKQPVQAQLLNYSREGQPYWLEIHIVPLKDTNGRVTHFMAIERDITQRLAMEEQLRQSQRLESIGHLTGGIAHDFNNLLTVIMGNAELLAEQSVNDPMMDELASGISTAAQRGADLTQRLLAFARRQPLDPKPVDINRLITDMGGMLRRTLGSDIEIEMTCDADLWQAMIDPGQLENALLNLCINARDAMSEGGKLTIETANARIDSTYSAMYDLDTGQYVMVAVSDTGEGIAPEHIEHIFEPFYTTKKKGKGTGLGLSMVYGFIKQSGGHVKLYSELGEGTTVRMYLPGTDSNCEPEVNNLCIAPIEEGAETILLVEDDELVRRHVQGLLRSLGYRVLTAADGASALELLDKHDDIALLFTDVVMPGGIGGGKLAKKAIRKRPGLRVLFTSGYTESSIVHRGRLDPGVLLLSKPYRKADLARAIRNALGRHGSDNR
jgi:PAS domain S-box-containing protein